MAASTTTGFSVAVTAPAAPASPSHRRRRISPQAGRALEILGHSIEYLTDEFIHQGGSLFTRDGQLEAVQLLMALNRQIYYECPQVPTFGERCQALLRVHAA
jgi:hypothetical protein